MKNTADSTILFLPSLFVGLDMGCDTLMTQGMSLSVSGGAGDSSLGVLPLKERRQQGNANANVQQEENARRQYKRLHRTQIAKRGREGGRVGCDHI